MHIGSILLHEYYLIDIFWVHGKLIFDFSDLKYPYSAIGDQCRVPERHSTAEGEEERVI